MHENSLVFLIPILISLGAFAMIFGISYLANREKMAMIEKGMNPKSLRRTAPRYLKWGLLLIGAGLGLLLAFLIDTLMIPRAVEPVAVYFSLIAIGGGLGLVASYKMEQKEPLEKDGL
jgi:O-antigen/teichoic acid export membrane protein